MGPSPSPRLDARRAWGLRLAALLFGLLCATRASAADYVDPLDAFHAHVAPPGFIACTTYPTDAWDGADCEGLNPAFEAAERARLPRGMTLLGAGVFRADDWGFRAFAARLDGEPAAMSDADVPRFLEGLRAGMASASHLDGAAIDLRMEKIGELRVARAAYDVPSDPPTSGVDLFVFGAHASYELHFLGPRDHAAPLAAIAAQTQATLRATPARKKSHARVVVIVMLGLVALVGTGVLFALLADARRRRRAAAVAWPSLR
jgi:hypothetical protein